VPAGSLSQANAKALAAARTERIVAIVTIIVPLLAVIAAMFVLWGKGIGLLDVALCVAMYLFTGFGINMGFHRLFTHRSFQCATAVRALLGVAGSMSAQGPLFFWAACHRRHHRSSDEPGDPHSPHHYGGGARGVLRGWLHAHVWWMFHHQPENYFRLIPDLLRDRLARIVNRGYFYWIGLGLLVPFAIGGLVTRSWGGALTGLLWGGLVRTFLVHHTTWSINSVCHMFGARPFDTGDESRNNYLCALLTFGEGFHNNHHAFPTSARHGLRWWELDLVYVMIRSLGALGLVWDVKLPDERGIDRKARTRERMSSG
jgi:stearoyl-CoA desaturase (delta-9 desaturase)